MSTASTPPTTRHHLLSVLVENKAGAGPVVGAADERFSRITIVADADSAPLEQIVKQLNKLVNVIKISELDPLDSVERELMLCTVKADASSRHNVIELVSIFDGRIVDVGHGEVTLAVAEIPARLDDLEELLKPFGILIVQRTGRVALPKLDRTFTR